MAQPFLAHFGVHSRRQELCRVTMPKIVETDIRQFRKSPDCLGKLMGHSHGFDRRSVSTREDKRFTCLSDADSEQLFGLFGAETAKLIGCEAWQRDRSSLVGFGRLKPKTERLSLFDTFNYMYDTALKIGIFPTKRE